MQELLQRLVQVKSSANSSPVFFLIKSRWFRYSDKLRPRRFSTFVAASDTLTPKRLNHKFWVYWQNNTQCGRRVRVAAGRARGDSRMLRWAGWLRSTPRPRTALDFRDKRSAN